MPKSVCKSPKTTRKSNICTGISKYIRILAHICCSKISCIFTCSRYQNLFLALTRSQIERLEALLSPGEKISLEFRDIFQRA